MGCVHSAPERVTTNREAAEISSFMKKGDVREAAGMSRDFLRFKTDYVGLQYAWANVVVNEIKMEKGLLWRSRCYG